MRPILIKATCIFIIIHYGLALANLSKTGHELALKAREALKKSNYRYGKPEIVKRAWSGEESMRFEVEKHIYWLDNAKGKPIRVDYYQIATIWSTLFGKDRFIATKIYTYDKAGRIKYLIWLDKEGEIQKFTLHIPEIIIKRNNSCSTEIIQEEFIDYNYSGIMIKRDVWSYNVNHDEKKVKFEKKRIQSDGTATIMESGDWVYSDFARPDGKSGCQKRQ